MSVQELEDWETYYELEPWGTPIEDNRWRMHYQLQWYGHGFKGEYPEALNLDRDPEETARLNAIAAAQVSQEDQLIAFFSARAVKRKVKPTE